MMLKSSSILYFFRRFSARAIDSILVVFLASAVVLGFIFIISLTNSAEFDSFFRLVGSQDQVVLDLKTLVDTCDTLDFAEGVEVDCSQANSYFYKFLIAVAISTLIANFVYFVLIGYLFKGSLGKLLLGLKVVSDDGRTPDILQMLARESIWLLINATRLLVVVFSFVDPIFENLISLILAFDLTFVMLRLDSKAGHDMIAMTKVVDINN